MILRNMVERRGKLATLIAMGFPRSSLVRLMLAENAFLLTVGLSLGSLSALIAVAPELSFLQR